VAGIREAYIDRPIHAQLTAATSASISSAAISVSS